MATFINQYIKFIRGNKCHQSGRMLKLLSFIYEHKDAAEEKISIMNVIIHVKCYNVLGN